MCGKKSPLPHFRNTAGAPLRLAVVRTRPLPFRVRFIIARHREWKTFRTQHVIHLRSSTVYRRTRIPYPARLHTLYADKTFSTRTSRPQSAEMAADRLVASTYLGNLNCPLFDPSVPNELITLPLTSNICMRWLLQSETITRFVFDTAM